MRKLIASQGEPCILAVDLGTSAVKVALIDVQGRVLGWEQAPLRLCLTADGGAEQTPEDWWQGLVTATRRLLSRKVAPREAVVGVCCSTQGEGTVAVDRDGNALMNCVLWMDMRGAPHLAAQAGGPLRVAGVNPLRLVPWLRLTGGMPSLTGKDPASHMLLIRDRFPQVYERTYKFLNVLDYLNLRLSGRYVATFDSIVTSWVTDNRNPDGVHYDAGLVRASGIDADKFPQIVPCTAVLGTLRPEAAEALGLRTTVKVVAGAIDNTAAAIGAGAVDDNAPHLYIGTSSWIAAHVPYKKTALSSGIASIPCAVPGRYLLTALQATAGGNLTFLRDNILYYKDELLPGGDLPSFFGALDSVVARTPAGSHGVMYTPWIWGERAPVEDRCLRGGLYNLSLNSTRADIVRAVLEGVAFNTRWLLAPVEKFLGRRVQGMNIAGGGAQSDAWCQIFADVLNLEFRQVEDPVQANARGAAWIGAVGLGEIRFEDVPGLVRFRRIYHPTAAHRQVYDERFKAFQHIYSQMRGIYKQLNGPAAKIRL